MTGSRPPWGCHHPWSEFKVFRTGPGTLFSTETALKLGLNSTRVKVLFLDTNSSASWFGHIKVAEQQFATSLEPEIPSLSNENVLGP